MSKGMRVLFAMSGGYGGGGGNKSRVQNFARGLREIGAETFVMALWSGDSSQPAGRWQEDERGIPALVVAPPAHGRFDSWRLYFQSRRLLRESVCDFIEKAPIDAVYLYGPSWHGLGPIIGYCRRRGIPCVMDLNEWYPLRPRCHPQYWDQQLFYRRAFPSIGGVVAISRVWEDYCRSRGVPAVRIPALCEAEFTCPQYPSRQEQGPFTIIYLAPVARRDLPLTMLEGVRRAVKAGVDARLVVVGRATEKPDGRRAIQAAQADPVLRDRVTFTGWIAEAEVGRRLGEADATLLLRPETWETRACFPTRLPQYLLTAHPAIVSAAGDLPLYLRHRENAWLLPPGDRPAELAEAIGYLAGHREEAAAIGRGGWKAALDRFSYRKHAPRLLEFLCRLRRGNEPGHG